MNAFDSSQLMNNQVKMWTAQLFHLGIVVLTLLSKEAVSQQDDSTLQEKLIDQLYKDYFEWKYTVWSPEAGKI